MFLRINHKCKHCGLRIVITPSENVMKVGVEYSKRR